MRGGLVVGGVVDALLGRALSVVDLAVDLVLGVADALLELDDALAEGAHDAGEARSEQDEGDDPDQDGLRRPEIEDRHGKEAVHWVSPVDRRGCGQSTSR